MTPARATEFTVRLVRGPVVQLDMVAGLALVGRAALSRRCWRLFLKTMLTFEAGPDFSWHWQEIELSQAEATMAEGNAEDDVPAAIGVRVAWTRLGAPTIEFLDKDGVVFAVAEFEPEGFSVLIGECCDVLEAVTKGGLATVVCKGAA